MNHSDIQALMADYLEGDLPLAKRALFDGHLDGCEGCAGEVAEMRRTIGLLRALPTPEPPPDLIDNVMRRIREGEGQPTRLDRLAGWLSELAAPRIAIPATALAAAVAIALITGDLQVDLPGIGERPGGPQLAAAPSSQPREAARPASDGTAPLSPKIASRVGVEGGGAPEARPSTQIAAAPRPARARTAPGAELAAGGSSSPAGGAESGRFQVLTPAGREPAQLFGGTGPIEDPGSLVSVGTLERPKTMPVSGDVPKDQRRLIELDGRLNSLVREPVEFSRWMSGLTVAEQELWLAQLAERAQERGLVEAVSLALSEGDDATGQSLAAAFDAEAERSNPSNVVSPETDPVSE